MPVREQSIRDPQGLLRFRLRQFWHRPRIKEAKHELVITRDDYQWTDSEADQWLVDLLGRPMVESLRGRTVLDFGCGVGRLTGAALRAGAHRIYAVDVSDTMLRHARGQFGLGAQRKIEFVVSNGDDCGMMPDGMADVTFSALTFQHMLSKQQAVDCFRSLIKATRPGGTIVIQGHHGGRTDDTSVPTFDGVRISPRDLDVQGVLLTNSRVFPGQPRWWVAEFRKCT